MKIKQSFCFREEQLDRLKRLSLRTGAPMAELLRRALDDYLIARDIDRERIENATKSAA